MKTKKTIKTVSYRPSQLTEGFLDKFAGEEESRLSKSGLIEIALRFLMEWPEEEFTQIVGNSISQERLHALVEEYMRCINGLRE